MAPVICYALQFVCCQLCENGMQIIPPLLFWSKADRRRCIESNKPPASFLYLRQKLSLVWIAAGRYKASYRQANNEAMIPQSSTCIGKNGKEEGGKWNR